ncbi:MAG: metallophosphoesterase [Flexilinea sp.]
MKNRHLVLSDVHENQNSLMRFILKATKSRGGFDDIWLLGDLFGHSEDAVGEKRLRRSFLSVLSDLSQVPIQSVFGNWEYWLMHPEKDRENEAQQNFIESLSTRRTAFRRKKISLVKRMMENSTLALPEKNPEFTLFHGCSFSCHDTTEYHADPWESYLYPHDLNIVTRSLFGSSDNLRTPHFLFGHTHKPGFFVYSKTSLVTMWRMFSIEMSEVPVYYGHENQRFGINPGSAGIAQRNIPRTAMILDTAEKTFQYIIDEDDSMEVNRRWFIGLLSKKETKSAVGRNRMPAG